MTLNAPSVEIGADDRNIDRIEYCCEFRLASIGATMTGTVAIRARGVENPKTVRGSLSSLRLVSIEHALNAIHQLLAVLEAVRSAVGPRRNHLFLLNIRDCVVSLPGNTSLPTCHTPLHLTSNSSTLSCTQALGSK